MILISESTNSPSLMKYQGIELVQLEAQLLLALEMIIGEEIPHLNLENYKRVRFGFVVKNNHIICLGFKNKNLSCLPKAFKNFKKLEILDLNDEVSLNISDVIKCLKNLKEVNINGNLIQNISDLYQKSLPDNLILIFDTKEELIKKNKNDILNTNPMKTVTIPINEPKIDLNSKLTDILEQARNKDELFNPRNEKNPLTYCEDCKNRSYKFNKVSLELVRESPRKLVFVIAGVSMICSNCKRLKEVLNPTPAYLNLIPNFIDNLKNELKFHLKQHQYCKLCNTYYKNLAQCPIHCIVLEIPPLVFIRGISKQYASKSLMNNE